MKTFELYNCLNLCLHPRICCLFSENETINPCLLNIPFYSKSKCILRKFSTLKLTSALDLGVDVDYALDIPGYPAGDTTIRCIILCATGDYPAQCEMGKFINGGIMACRRDYMKGFLFSCILFQYAM